MQEKKIFFTTQNNRCEMQYFTSTILAFDCSIVLLESSI